MVSVIGTLSRLNKPFDIVIIMMGDTDLTAQKANECGADVIRHPTNLGYSAAIQTGFKYVQKRKAIRTLFFLMGMVNTFYPISAI